MGGFAGGFAMDFFQSQQMSQQMQLSPQMLQSLNILMMNHYDLTANIQQLAEANPAIEILRDASLDVKTAPQKKRRLQEEFRPHLHQADREERSDNFQKFLESREDVPDSIQLHLWKQFRLATSDKSQLELGEMLIMDLDSRGFVQQSPHSQLEYFLRHQQEPALSREKGEQLLRSCLEAIRNLEPAGCCTSGPEESLYVQALGKKREAQAGALQQVPVNSPAMETSLFILAGNLSLLERLQIPLITSKLKELQAAQGEKSYTWQAPASTASWTPPPQFHPLPEKITKELVEQAVSFIKSLDPLPARQFDSQPTVFIRPDVLVEQVDSDQEASFKVTVNDKILPEVILSPAYKELSAHMQSLTADSRKQVRQSVKEAQDLMQALDLRKATLRKAALAIVELQRDFFLKGPRYLRPLRMKDLAEHIGVNESTISRMARDKYLRCQWGSFEMRYFFSNQVATSPVSSQQQADDASSQPTEALSKEGVKFMLKELLEEHQRAGSTKPLSDQKISEVLAQRGIKIARRTVAKYRSELNIDSSFDRK